MSAISNAVEVLTNSLTTLLSGFINFIAYAVSGLANILNSLAPGLGNMIGAVIVIVGIVAIVVKLFRRGLNLKGLFSSVTNIVGL